MGADPTGIKQPMYLMGHQLLIAIYWFKNPIQVTRLDIVFVYAITFKQLCSTNFMFGEIEWFLCSTINFT